MSLETELGQAIYLYLNKHKAEFRPKFYMLITGGGFGLMDIGKIPGSSDVLFRCHIPYDYRAQLDFISSIKGEEWVHQRFEVEKKSVEEVLHDWHSVDASASEIYCKALIREAEVSTSKEDFIFVSVTSALTSNRFRRSDNRAYVSIRRNKNSSIENWKISLNKIDESYYDGNHFGDIYHQRIIEDRKISLAIIAILGDVAELAKYTLSKGERIFSLQGKDYKEQEWCSGCM